MFKLLGAYFGGTFALTIAKFFMYLGGGWIALSPSTFIYASVLYFLTGTLTLKLLVKIDAEQSGMLPDKDSLDFFSWQAVFVAVLPVAWVLGTTLYWDGSYYCSAFVVDKGFVFAMDVSGKVGSVTQVLIEAKEQSCLKDPVGYFTAGGLLNTLILYLAWLYTLVVLSVILYVAWHQSKMVFFHESCRADFDPSIWKIVDCTAVNAPERVLCVEDILKNLKTATSKAAKKKLLEKFLRFMPWYPSTGKYDLRGSMIREVLEMVPSFYSPSEITKGQLENKIAELKEVLQSIERKL